MMTMPSIRKCLLVLATSALLIVIASFIPWGRDGYYVADTLVVLGTFGFSASIMILAYGHLLTWMRKKAGLP